MTTYNSVSGHLNGVTDETINLESEAPIECPSCHIGVKVLFITHSTQENDSQVFMKCPLCKNCFIGRYIKRNDQIYYFNNFYDYKNPKPKKEEKEEIRKVSKNFVLIYYESEKAEEYGLKQICGVGYRKAFEFLIKDYLVFNLNLEEENYEEKKSNIINKNLSNCISEDIGDDRIREMAKRAAWLGNDETHYTRKWEEKDLSDLKKLIEIVIHFIEIDILSKKYLGDMS